MALCSKRGLKAMKYAHHDGSPLRDVVEVQVKQTTGSDIRKAAYHHLSILVRHYNDRKAVKL